MKIVLRSGLFRVYRDDVELACFKSLMRCLEYVEVETYMSYRR